MKKNNFKNRRKVYQDVLDSEPQDKDILNISRYNLKFQFPKHWITASMKSKETSREEIDRFLWMKNLKLQTRFSTEEKRVYSQHKWC